MVKPIHFYQELKQMIEPPTHSKYDKKTNKDIKKRPFLMQFDTVLFRFYPAHLFHTLYQKT
jgi:hypothetical protein